MTGAKDEHIKSDKDCVQRGSGWMDGYMCQIQDFHIGARVVVLVPKPNHDVTRNVSQQALFTKCNQTMHIYYC